MRRARASRNSYTDNVLTSEKQVVPTTDQHINDAIEWMQLRGMPALPHDVFSSSGFVIPGVAAVWLFFTNSSMATLEFLISNPHAPKEQRRSALDAVVGRAIAEAKAAGVRLLSAYVQRDDVERLGRKHALARTGIVAVISRNLQKEN
jgi:hypothetical protein